MKLIFTSLLLSLMVGAFAQGSVFVENISQCDYEITFTTQDPNNDCNETQYQETYISGDVRTTTFTGCSSCELTLVTICSATGNCCISITQPHGCYTCTQPYSSEPTSFLGRMCTGDNCNVLIYWDGCNQLRIIDYP